MEFNDILDLILVSDETQLSKINSAVKQRKDILQQRTMAEMGIGDIVTLNTKTRPKYLQGCKAEIKKINQTTVGLVILPDFKDKARRYGHGQFRCPISLVDLEVI